MCRIVCICFRQREKKVSDDILQIPVDDFQNYFFFLEPTVFFGSLFPSAINKKKKKTTYLKTWLFEMSLQYSTYFLVKEKNNQPKALVDFHVLEGRTVFLYRVGTAKTRRLKGKESEQRALVSNINLISKFISSISLLIFRKY